MVDLRKIHIYSSMEWHFFGHQNFPETDTCGRILHTLKYYMNGFIWIYFINI